MASKRDHGLLGDGSDDGVFMIKSKSPSKSAFQNKLASTKRSRASMPTERMLLTAIRTLKPTVIIGVAAVGGTFTPEVLQTMAKINKRPIIFALSNPTSKAECSAEEAYRHTAGRALFACGSPYDPVKLDGKTFVPRQGNNSYIFPGIGLGAIASGTRLVTDEMFMAAAHTLAQLVSEADLDQGSLYPALPRIREVSARIAAAVRSTSSPVSRPVIRVSPIARAWAIRR